MMRLGAPPSRVLLPGAAGGAVRAGGLADR